MCELFAGLRMPRATFSAITLSRGTGRHGTFHHAGKMMLALAPAGGQEVRGPPSQQNSRGRGKGGLPGMQAGGVACALQRVESEVAAAHTPLHPLPPAPGL
jgi:hypothetical protein